MATKGIAERLREIWAHAEKNRDYAVRKQGYRLLEGPYAVAARGFCAGYNAALEYVFDRLSKLEQVASDGAVVTANITVNGNAYLFEGKTISYEQVAVLAGHPGCKELTMTYHGKGQLIGLLDPGESIPLRDKTHFCAVVTNNA